MWLDRFGIPPVGVIMPPNAEKGEQGAYMDLARKFARGGSGILPNGASVVYGTEARAVCPFIDFIRFQQQQIYLVGIGRVQSGETDGANLGGNAAGVVEDGFRRLVRRDARRIARAVNDCVTRRVLGRLFPGRPALAQFAWDTEARRTSREVLEDAGLAKSAGLAIDIGQLRELTGYTLEKAPETPPPGPFGGLNSRAPGETPLQTLENPLQNAPRGDAPARTPPEGTPALKRALARFAEDCGPLAAEVGELLKDPAPEKARELLEKLPGLAPEDPALAAVIAEEMAKAYGEAFTQARSQSAPQEEVVNFNPDQPRGQPDNAGQFVSTGGADGEPTDKPQPKNPQTPADYRKLADSVSPERVAEICKADSKQPCKIEEALAVLRTNPKVRNALGEDVTFGSDMGEKYLTGRGRPGNVPQPERLKELPIAMFAVKHDPNPKLQYLAGAIHDPLNPPRGTQKQYTTPATDGPMIARAWADSGKVTGWYVETKKPA